MLAVAHKKPPQYRANTPHAAPTELGGLRGTCGYKHGAPNGAFAAPSPPRRTKDACKEQQGTAALQNASGWRSFWSAPVPLSAGAFSFRLRCPSQSGRGLHLIRIFGGGNRSSSVRSIMFIVTTTR